MAQTEAELVAKVLQQDEQATRVLIEDWLKPAAKRVLLARKEFDEEVDELVNEFFLHNLPRCLKNFRGKGLTPLLLHSLRYFRIEQCRKPCPVPVILEPSAVKLGTEDFSGARPANVITEMKMAIQDQCLRQLPEEDYEMVLDKYGNGLSRMELATKYGYDLDEASLSRLDRRISGIKKRLREDPGMKSLDRELRSKLN